MVQTTAAAVVRDQEGEQVERRRSRFGGAQLGPALGAETDESPVSESLVSCHIAHERAPDNSGSHGSQHGVA